MKDWTCFIALTLVFNLFLISCAMPKPVTDTSHESLQQKDLVLMKNQSTFPRETSIVKAILDEQQNLIVAGNTNASTLSTQNAFQTELQGEHSGFIAKISPEGETIWSTYIGGAGSDFIQDMFIGTHHQLVILGVSNSSQFVMKSSDENYTADEAMYFFRAQITMDSTFLHFQRISLPPLPMIKANTMSARIYGDEKHCIIVNPWMLEQLSQDQELLLDPLYADNSIIFADYAGNILWTKDGRNSPHNIKQVLLDASRNAVYVAGSTSSTSFPLVRATLSEYASAYQSNAFLMKMDNDGAIIWSTFLWNQAKDDSIADSIIIDEKGWLYLGGRIIAYPEEKDSSAGNLSAWNPKTNLSALWRVVDQEGRFIENQIREDNNYPFHVWNLMSNLNITINQHNTLAFASNLSLVEQLDELMKQSLVHPYQAFPFGSSENQEANETNIIFKMNRKGEMVFSTYYGGSDIGSFVVEDIKLGDHDQLFLMGRIQNLKSSQSSHLDIPSEAFGMENQIAFVSVFNPEGQKTGIVFFGVDE